MLNLVVAGILWSALSSEPQQQVENDRPRFSCRLPAGYALTREEEDSRFYLKESPPSSGVRFVVTVSILSAETREGEISRRREELAGEMAAMLPKPSTVTSALRHMTWKGHTIEILELRFSREGQALIAAMAFLPTLGRSVRMEVLGPEHKEPDIYADLGEIVRSFEAKASWLRPEHLRSMKVAPLPAVISMIGAPAYILAWVIFFRRKPKRLLKTRIAWMLAMGGLMLLPPFLWDASLRDTPIQPPVVCTWPAPVFFAAPWLMLGTARLVALLLQAKAPEEGGPPQGADTGGR